MKISIDEQTEEFPLQKNTVTLKKVIEEIEDSLMKQERTFFYLSLNGKEIPIQELPNQEEKIIDDTDVIELHTHRIEEFLCKRIQKASQANQHFLQLLQKFSRDLEEQAASQTLAQITIETKSFFLFWKEMEQLFSLAKKDSSSIKQAKIFGEWLEEMKELFHKITKSMEEKDPFLASDLISYELIPAVQKAEKFLQNMEGNLYISLFSSSTEG